MIIKYFDELNGSWFDVTGNVGDGLVIGASGWTSAQLNKKYIATITQTSTNAPFVNQEFFNNIGNIVWTRISAGQYNGYLLDGFIGNVPKKESVVNIYDGNTIRYYTIVKTDDSNIQLRTYLSDGTTFTDNILKETTIEISIY